MLPDVFQVMCFPYHNLLTSVILFYHLSYGARAVKSLKEVIVLLLLQLLPVNVPLSIVRQPCTLGMGSIGNVTNVIIELMNTRHVAVGRVFPTSGH